ncbi:Hypothetical protein CINCED_3A011101 [Cinara cedri]|uniref:Uncharacterized protein n=1 Tax=Cinara cedri TaxID=506608 RepID=A0A5E4MBW9_9HEMI|nr:Hypothetical protein CINCED_3A011101 [Cinara cedri]
MVDLKNAFIFNHIRALHEQPSFKQVYNRGSRNARIFLHENDPVNDWEYFEIFVANPLTVDLLKWIYDLLIKRPDAVEQFTRNPFSDEPDVLGEMCDVIGRKVKSSYLMALRIFYKWASRELFMVLSGEIHDRLSLLDNHIKQNLSLNTSWTQLFDDCYRYVLEYFTKILQHYNCPADILETFHVTGQYELFRELVRFCVQVLVDTNSFLGYRESSTSSNESTTDFSSASCSSQA